MPVMRCVECGTDARPRHYHPSSLRVEAAVWLVAVVVGLASGVWSAAARNGGAASERTSPAFAALSIRTTDAPALEVAQVVSEQPGTAARFGGWLWARFLRFLGVAWWTLPIPLAFSLWRQFATRAGCPRCGSRRLSPAPDYPG